MVILFFLLAITASALPFFTGTVYYMVADDYLLNYIGNGSYGREFSDHLTFIRMPIGILLKFLYGITASVNWYFILLLGLTVLSFTLLHLVLWRRTKSLPLLILGLLVNYMVVAHFLSFTVVAYLVAGAGLCTFLSALRDGRHIRLSFCICLAGLLASFFLRRDASLSSILLFLPLLSFSLIKMMKNEPGIIPHLLIQAAVFASVFALSLFLEKGAYSSKEWQDFQNYDNARSAVVDNYTVPYERVKESMEAIHISNLDNNLLNSWRYTEKSFFTEEVLTEVAKINREAITFEDRVDSMRRVMPLRLLPFLLAPLIFFVFLLIGGRIRLRTMDLLPAVLLLLFGAGLLFAIAFIRLRFVMRVAIPTQLLVSCGLITCADPLGMKLTKHISGKVCASPQRTSALLNASTSSLRRLLVDTAALIALTAATAQFWGYYQAINPVDRISPDEPAYAALTEEIASHPDTLYVFDSSALSKLYYYGTPAAQVKTTERFHNVTRAGSWDSYSPRYYAQIGSFLENPDDLLTALVDAPNIAFVTGGDGSEIGAFYKEQRGKKVKRSKTEFPDSGFSVVVFSVKG